MNAQVKFCSIILQGILQGLLAGLLLLPAAAPGEDPEGAALRRGLGELQALIKPGPDEARWAQVPWMPSADIWAARKKAAEAGKPLFLWYMAGEPLGTC